MTVLSLTTLEFFCFVFWPCHTACEILVSRLTRDHTWALAVKLLSSNHRSAREFPLTILLKDKLYWKVKS